MQWVRMGPHVRPNTSTSRANAKGVTTSSLAKPMTTEPYEGLSRASARRSSPRGNRPGTAPLLVTSRSRPPPHTRLPASVPRTCALSKDACCTIPGLRYGPSMAPPPSPPPRIRLPMHPLAQLTPGQLCAQCAHPSPALCRPALRCAAGPAWPLPRRSAPSRRTGRCAASASGAPPSASSPPGCPAFS